MKKSLGFLLAATLLSLSTLPALATDGADSVSSAEEGTPLMVIRFNQPRVDYAMPVYNTLTQALKVKPSAMFDVVSVAPHARVAHNQPYFDKLAADNSAKVLATLHQIGLPDRRIHSSTITDAVDSSEVRIYVH